MLRRHGNFYGLPLLFVLLPAGGQGVLIMQAKGDVTMSIEYQDRYHEVREISTLKEMLDQSAELYGKRPAFLVKKEKGAPYSEITYRQLKHDVDALGTMLLEMGLAGQKIAIIGENCYEWVVTYYATINGTGVVVPLDKELSQEEIGNLLEIAGCKAIFYTKSYAGYFEDLDIPFKIEMKVYGDRTDLSQALPRQKQGEALTWEHLVAGGEKRLEQGNRDFVDAQIDPDRMHILLFTSGTTEAAKGVMLSHRNVAADIMDTCRIALVTPEDRTLSILPIHHTFESTMGMSLVLYRGASTAFYEGLKYIVKNLNEAQASVLIGVPLIFESMHEKIWKQAEKSGQAGILKKGIKLNRTLSAMGIHAHRKIFKNVYAKFGGKLRLIITGAAGIDPNVYRGFEDLGFAVLQGYGLTECAPLVSGTPDFCHRYSKAGSVGPAVASGELRIDSPDEDGIGEIVFRGPNVMLGYYKMPEKTAEVLKDGWFYTGDLGFIDKDGWLYITGRRKNVIVTKTGKNIYPEEVEMYINRNKYIQESLVHGVEMEDDTLVSAQIRPAFDVIYEEFGENYKEDDIYSLIKETLKDINEKLPVYKRVRDFTIRTDEFVKTTTKKIKRFKSTEESHKK